MIERKDRVSDDKKKIFTMVIIWIGETERQREREREREREKR